MLHLRSRRSAGRRVFGQTFKMYLQAKVKLWPGNRQGRCLVIQKCRLPGEVVPGLASCSGEAKASSRCTWFSAGIFLSCIQQSALTYTGQGKLWKRMHRLISSTDMLVRTQILSTQPHLSESHFWKLALVAAPCWEPLWVLCLHPQTSFLFQAEVTYLAIPGTGASTIL